MPYRRTNTRTRNTRNTNRHSGSRRKSRFTNIERFAFKMGQVERASANSRVRDSFEKGKREPQKKEKKPLF